jgi:hypothetical protein
VAFSAGFRTHRFQPLLELNLYFFATLSVHDAMLYMLTQSVLGVSVFESSHGSSPNASRVCAFVGRNVDIEIVESPQQESY